MNNQSENTPQNKCSEYDYCDGSCKSYKKTTSKHYYHYIMKYDINKQRERENMKPDCCDSCFKKNVEIKFLDEPFCSEILEIHCPFWLCDDCYESSKDNI